MVNWKTIGKFGMLAISLAANSGAAFLADTQEAKAAPNEAPLNCQFGGTGTVDCYTATGQIVNNYGITYTAADGLEAYFAIGSDLIPISQNFFIADYAGEDGITPGEVVVLPTVDLTPYNLYAGTQVFLMIEEDYSPDTYEAVKIGTIPANCNPTFTPTATLTPTATKTPFQGQASFEASASVDCSNSAGSITNTGNIAYTGQPTANFYWAVGPNKNSLTPVTSPMSILSLDNNGSIDAGETVFSDGPDYSALMQYGGQNLYFVVDKPHFNGNTDPIVESAGQIPTDCWPTITPTFTPTRTPTLTFTPTETQTPTITYTPTITNTPNWPTLTPGSPTATAVSLTATPNQGGGNYNEDSGNGYLWLVGAASLGLGYSAYRLINNGKGLDGTRP